MKEYVAMQKLVFLVLMLVGSLSLFAQDGFNAADTIPPYKKTNKLPYFSILQPDSTWFTAKQLPENKPVVIIYFSPECGHCQMTAKEFVSDMDKLKNVELLWITYHNPQQIKEFADSYGLSHFDNVVLGRDPNYFFVPFYKIEFTPFMAVYDKKGKFLQAYKAGTDANTIARLLNSTR